MADDRCSELLAWAEKVLAWNAVNTVSAFISAWEFDSFKDDVDGEELMKELKRIVRGLDA